MGAFQKIFDDYGADYSVTMERFMGNEGMYFKFLNMLLEDQSLKNLGAALAASDYQGAFEAAHTLKGVAGNMGLTPLYNVVCEIVEPLRLRERRDDYKALYQNIEEEFRKVEALRTALEK
ncbi:Hpt domain-containing protein [Gehongia tenuis]|uniref:Hpt domain-containing protein n=1 Tax=Gehongia tenuis TaxID=2763655 RepID=A0A926D5I1_9FIRM|nr:Hpt domain-containing protein [Gehongia tenuis]MBC8531733.1 Hpt domain-containing protein [Gehongia tenuis]